MKYHGPVSFTIQYNKQFILCQISDKKTCHLHILVMSQELATGVDLYTLIALVQFSEIGTELDIMEPCYEEPCMSSTTP